MTTLVTVCLIDDGGQRALRWDAGSLKAEYVDQTIAGLAIVREQMIPVVSETPPPAEVPLRAQFDPRWSLAPDPFVGGACLKIRHSAFGWIAFALPLKSPRDFHSALDIVLSDAEERAAGERAN